MNSMTLIIFIGVLCIFILYYIFSTFYMSNEKKIVIFDMDETLGHFGEIGTLWSILKDINNKLTKKDFYKLMDIYPETLRPHILNILEYLKDMKKKGKIDRVIIFTNNQGPKSWSLLIKDYFNNKIDYHLIDKVVGAYKVGTKQIEPYRTSHEKVYEDILNAARIPKNAKIAFIDDQKHYRMLNKNVFYVVIHGYTYHLSPEQVVTRIEKNNIFNINNEDMGYIYETLKNINHRFVVPENYNYQIFKQNGKNILKNIKKFVNNF